MQPIRMSDRIAWSTLSSVVPWLAVAIVVIATAYVNSAIDLRALTFEAYSSVAADALTPANTDLLLVAKHLLARVAWGVPAIGFAIVAVVAIATAVWVTKVCLRDVARTERMQYAAAIAIACVCLVAIVAYLVRYLGGEIMSEPDVTTQLRIATLHRTPATRAVALDSSFDTLSYVIFILLLTSASATLMWSRTVAPTIASLCARLKQTRWLLYVGAAALVLRAIEMDMLYRWPGVWFSTEKAAAIDHVALALSTAHGAFFSAVLMALYMPTALILRLRINSLATRAVEGGNEAPDAWLAKAGVAASPFKEIATVFLTLAPLLAGGSVAKVMAVFAA